MKEQQFIMDKEIWVPVQNYEGIYEVSNYGQIRSLDRLIHTSNGKVYTIHGRILRQSLSPHGTNPVVCLAKEGRNRNFEVRYLVYMNFFENAEEDDVVKHKDGDSTNNRVDNLYVEEIIDLPGEEWRPVRGYEGYYEISNKGRLKCLKRKVSYFNPYSNSICTRTHKERLIVCVTSKDNYITSQLTKENIVKDVSIHRLVAEAFIPNPENKPQINHIDGDPRNNTIENLEWCTAKENVQDYLVKRGRKNLTNLIKSKYGRKIVCLDNMMKFQSLTEVRKYFHGSDPNYSIKYRTCSKGFTFVYEETLNDPNFDVESYLEETRNRYSKWMHAKRTIERTNTETKSVL